MDNQWKHGMRNITLGNCIMINGIRYELSDELVKQLVGVIESEECCVCDRVENCTYYYVNSMSEVDSYRDTDCPDDDEMYEIANYYKAEEKANQIAMHQTLYRLLDRFSEQHGGDAEWDNNNMHYYIYYDVADETYGVDYEVIYKISNVYFRSEEVAQAAVEKIIEPFMAEHPDFIW